MTYQFKGFFTNDHAVAIAAVAKWPCCIYKRVTEQMNGYVIRIQPERQLHTAEANDVRTPRAQRRFEIKQELPDFSKNYPDQIFVYIEVECFGGACDYSGLHVRDGKVLTDFKEDEKNGEGLAEILAPMGVNMNESTYFAPFTRGYFDDQDRSF